MSATRAFSLDRAGYPQSPLGLRSLPVMAVEIKPVRSRVARHRFVDFPFRLFKHDPTWVPPLRISVLDRISPKYPANDHQDTALWMAYRDGKPVGRIGACVDHKFNEFQDQSWAWVGFFEAFDDPEAAAALFDTVPHSPEPAVLRAPLGRRRVGASHGPVGLDLRQGEGRAG